MSSYVVDDWKIHDLELCFLKVSVIAPQFWIKTEGESQEKPLDRSDVIHVLENFPQYIDDTIADNDEFSSKTEF